jgi:PD-(D/E)XK nuclease superfamily
MLYTTSKGVEINSLSYSSGQVFSLCPRLFEITKVEGWSDKDNKAATRFGNCVEAGLSYYHYKNLQPGSGEARFRQLWSEVETEPGIEYSDKEGDWITLNQIGSDMLSLYEALLPTLPIQNPEFQLNYKKEVFPGHAEYGGIRHNAYVDLVSTLESPHPDYPGVTKWLIDIKTSGKEYPSVKNIVRLDPQLREYAWTSGINAVAFLVFVKVSPKMSRGDSVTLLVDTASHKKGQRLTLISQNEDINYSFITTEALYDSLLAEEKAITGKGSVKMKAELLEAFIDKSCIRVTPDSITKQKLQFLPGIMTEGDLQGVGQHIGRQIVEIKGCNDAGFYRQRPGIRFPDNHCLFCKGLGKCLGDDKLVEERLVKIEDLDW